MKAFTNISRGLSKSKLDIGLFAGVFLVRVIFLSVLPQIAVHSPNDNRATESPAVTKLDHEKEPTISPTNFTGEENLRPLRPSSALRPLKPICDLSDPRYDICEMWGDARTANGTNTSRVYFIPPPSQLAAAATAAATWSIRSQSRKIIPVREVTVRSLNLSRAMVILRGKTRRFVNAGAVVAAVGSAGFDVVRAEPTLAADMDAVSREVDACDVLLGAGLTNMVFLRTGAVVVQVIPWGNMETHGEAFFGAPAAHMGIRHVAYSIAAEESTLYEKYGRDHPVIADPDIFYRNGSNERYYWWEQNIRLNITRFMPTLERVKRMLVEE